MMDLLPRKVLPITFNASDWELRTVELSDCAELVARCHYAGRGANTATFKHGLFLKEDNHCYGIAWWIPPTRSCAEANFSGDWKKVLSLSRLAIEDEVPRNAESFLIGRSIRLIRQSGAWDCLLTWADSSQGHRGTIYRATNWEYLGTSKAEPSFTDAVGRLVSRKAGPVTRTREQMSELGYTRNAGSVKHRFRIIFKRW